MGKGEGNSHPPPPPPRKRRLLTAPPHAPRDGAAKPSAYAGLRRGRPARLYYGRARLWPASAALAAPAPAAWLLLLRRLRGTVGTEESITVRGRELSDELARGGRRGAHPGDEALGDR